MVAMCIAYAVILLLAGVDQGIKIWAIAELKNAQPRPFLQIGNWDWMHLCYVENNGAAFSMLRGARWFLVVLPIVMIFVCCFILHRHGKTHRWLFASLPLLAGGGLGNLIDRIFRGGFVVDYFDLQIFDFAIFNFADCCVTVGVIVMIIGILFIEKDDPSTKRLPKRKTAGRVPYARHCGTLDTVESLPDLPESEDAPDADILPDVTPSPDAAELPEAAKLPDLGQTND